MLSVALGKQNNDCRVHSWLRGSGADRESECPIQVREKILVVVPNVFGLFGFFF